MVEGLEPQSSASSATVPRGCETRPPQNKYELAI